METTRTAVPEPRLGQPVNTATSEWNAVGLRPIAHWVLMPTATGNRLSMVWEVPDPMPPRSPA
jgi:hypothetical protein